jgi:hypothetical protein
MVHRAKPLTLSIQSRRIKCPREMATVTIPAPRASHVLSATLRPPTISNRIIPRKSLEVAIATSADALGSPERWKRAMQETATEIHEIAVESHGVGVLIVIDRAVGPVELTMTMGSYE